MIKRIEGRKGLSIRAHNHTFRQERQPLMPTLVSLAVAIMLRELEAIESLWTGQTTRSNRGGKQRVDLRVCLFTRLESRKAVEAISLGSLA